MLARLDCTKPERTAIYVGNCNSTLRLDCTAITQQSYASSLMVLPYTAASLCIGLTVLLLHSCNASLGFMLEMSVLHWEYSHVQFQDMYWSTHVVTGITATLPWPIVQNSEHLSGALLRCVQTRLCIEVLSSKCQENHFNIQLTHFVSDTVDIDMQIMHALCSHYRLRQIPCPIARGN